jgi:hypothetical protein
MKTLLALCTVVALALGAASPAHAHWPGQPPHQMAELGDLKLESNPTPLAGSASGKKQEALVPLELRASHPT